MRFVDREQELAALNVILMRSGAQFMTIYGRRRVGKTTLLVEWARRSDVRTIYWVGAREPQTHAVALVLANRLSEYPSRCRA